MIYRCREDEARFTIRRFRSDALLISMLGLTGIAFSLWALVSGPALIALPLPGLFFSVVFLLSGVRALRTSGLERIDWDRKAGVLHLTRGREPVVQVRLQDIKNLTFPGKFYRSLELVSPNSRVCLFASVYTSPCLLRFVRALADQGVPLEAQLVQQLSTRLKSLRWLGITLLFVWLMLTVRWLLHDILH